jgi:N-methylhydantoinase B
VRVALAPPSVKRSRPKGTWRFVDHLDGDGIDPNPIPIVATVTIAGDEMTIDLTGSAPQVRGAINCVFPFTLSTALACVRSIVDLSIPNNAGYFRPIHVIAPEGTVVNPRPSAAVAARGITGIRIAGAIFGALAQAVAEVLPACGSNAPDVGISFGGIDTDNNPFVYLEFLLASWGGGPDRDGMDAYTGILVNYSNAPVENDRGGSAHRGRTLCAGARQRRRRQVSRRPRPGAEPAFPGE